MSISREADDADACPDVPNLRQYPFIESGNLQNATRAGISWQNGAELLKDGVLVVEPFIKEILKDLGVNSPAFDPQAGATVPLPQLYDKYGERVYLFARTLWLFGDGMPAADQLRSDDVIGGKTFAAQYGFGHTTDGHMARCVVAYQKIEDRTKCVFIAARRVPWSVESLRELMENRLEVPDVQDGYIVSPFVDRINTLQSDFSRVHDSAVHVSDTFTIVGHCLNTTSAGSRQKMLEEALDKYCGLLNLAVVIDKDNRVRGSGWRNNFFVLPPYEDECELPNSVGDAPMTIPRNDGPLFYGTLEILAEARLSEHWPYRHEVHEIVKFYWETLAGLEAGEELSVAVNQLNVKEGLLEAANAGLTDLKAELDAAVQEMSELKTYMAAAESQKKEAESWALQHVVRAQQLFDENADLKEQLSKALQREQQLQKSASSEHVDVKALQEENVALRRSLHAAESRARARYSGVTSEGASTALRAPGGWDELYACAVQLKNVRMYYSAVEPALDGLAHHTHSGNWLERTWICLVALDEFALTDRRRFPNFQIFLRENPREKLTGTHVALKEGETVRANARMKAERTFSTELGLVEMGAHVRVGSGQHPAPRLYFHNVGSVVYVGYIGPHLTNTQTN